MATFQDATAPRKRMATYGKAVRRRIPEYSFTSLARKPETPELRKELTPSPKLVPVDHQKLKTIRQRSASRTSSPASPVTANVFDVPSDDEVAPLTPKKTKVALKTIPKFRNSKDTSAGIAEDLDSRKRLKLSPVPGRPSPHSLSHQPVRLPVPKAIAQASKQLQRSTGKGHISTFATRPKPKPEVHQRKPVPQKSPRKPMSTNATSSVTPSPQLSDVEMMDVDLPAEYMFPRGIQMWKGLLESTDDREADDFTVNDERPVTAEITTMGVGVSETHISRKSLYKPARVSKSPQRNPRKLPRRRLIDSLVEQTTQQDHTDEESSSSNELEAITEISPSLQVPPSAVDVSSSQILAPKVQNPLVLGQGSQGSQNAGPKFTYGSKQRSMLAEQDLFQQLDFDIPSQPAPSLQNRRPRRGSIPTLQPLQSFQEENEDTEDGVAGTAIRNVHELRQAGANNRFLDEIEDLLDRIGSPSASASSMRRSGLLDLAGKMRDKNFARQFRATGVELRLFLHLGQETDLVAGFMMVTLLIALLADASMPHIVAHLRRQGITRLLIRLLDSQADIITVGKERKSNMSRVAQSLLSEHHEFLLQIPVWEDLRPQSISPRMAALKCLELMVRQTREAGNSGDIFSKELTTNLFSILHSAADENSWALPSGKQAIDFCLALSALESHSITARTVHDESIWINDYLPIIADALEVSLRRPVDEFGVLQLLILRLTLNVTNNNSKASDVFAREKLMAIMGQVIVSKFRKISRFLIEEELSVAVDHLILVLGVMINFAEWSSAARESLEGLQGMTDDPLNDMIQIFVDNQERTSEVSSSPRVNSFLTNYYRRNLWKKVPRMLHLVTSPSFWAMLRCSQVFPTELETGILERPSNH